MSKLLVRDREEKRFWWKNATRELSGKFSQALLFFFTFLKHLSFQRYSNILNFQPRLMHFLCSDWLSQSRLSAHIRYNF